MSIRMIEDVGTPWYVTLPVIVTLPLLVIVVYRLKYHSLSEFPGPFEAKISGLWRDRRFWRGTWHDDVLEVHQTYGPIVRVAPNELSIVDEGAIKALYGHGTLAVKTDWYATWEDPKSGPGIFTARDKQVHAFFRKRISAVFSMTAILRYEEHIQSCVSHMIHRLKIYGDREGQIDLSKWTDALAFDIIGELAYGRSFGNVENNGEDAVGIIALVHKGFYLMANMGHYWGQTRWINNALVLRLRSLLGVQDYFSDFAKWTKHKIFERKLNENKTEREDMLYHFLQMKKPDGSPVDEAEVQRSGMNVIGAGADTTASAMRACLYYLCRHPDFGTLVQDEIDAYYKAKDLQNPITYQQCQNLPLLCACIKEAIRLWPSITYPLLRHAPPGLEVDGRLVPAGTTVGVSPIAANRSQDIWGLDADRFNPNRWLEGDEKSKRLAAKDMAFGGNGPRACIGRNLALVELHVFVAQFMRTFSIEFVNLKQPWKVRSQWFANHHDMKVRIRSRRVKS